MVVRRIVAEVTRALHLIGEPPVDSLIEMRRLDVQQRDAQDSGNCQNSNLDPGKSFQPSGHANGIVPARTLFKSRARKVRFHKALDSLQDALIGVLLGLVARFQFALGDAK